ncbi:MAG: PKD domain-containing protein [Verrucomicrobia bacterium]|nr:PKD domain-containing protein [Verrucomicrobiota bacterium]
MKTRLLLTAAFAAPLTLTAANNQLLGWNNLGMHCMDSDYSVFSVLPPYNTVEAQLLVGGRLVTNGTGYTVTYQAVADPDGSFNSTARGKGNFYDFVLPLYGAAVSPESGLTPWPMPGTNNTPQPMLFEPTNRPAPGVATKVNWFRAEGIPITPYDDAGRKNPYPLMRLIARNGSGTPIASNDVVLPVSDEMDCRACHASGTQAAAQPFAGWVWSSNPERDFRLNILRLHDDYEFADDPELYAAALAARGFSPEGLYRGVVADGKPVLCAVCHASEALGTASFDSIQPLTAAMHGFHARVRDPDLHIQLDSSDHRGACYRCHPGSATKCLRGAMGSAIAADGSMEMQCQSCHGGMSAVGSLNRVGWFMEPNCQSCHTGTATSNNGRIRYTSCFETNGSVRVATNQTFATQADIPAPGISLYRFSAGHGGLQCSACHGSTHAEFPAAHRNDNLRNLALQGHAGMMIECTACHVSMAVNATMAVGGPHGLHPVGQAWANQHGDLIEGGLSRTACRACHGLNDRGTELSRAQANRVITTPENKYGTKNYWRGRTVSCYDCHDGANSSDPSTHPPAVAQSVSTNTTSGARVAMTLRATGNGSITYRIVTQPAHGSVGLSNGVATYFPDPGHVGTDQFAFTAWNGWVDSNLATGSVAVAQGPFSVSAVAHVPFSWPAGWPAPFAGVATPSNSTAAVTYDWDFGDNSPHVASQNASHVFAAPGLYHWRLVARAASAAATVSGVIVVGDAVQLDIARSTGGLTVSWPQVGVDVVLERSAALGTAAQWSRCTNTVLAGPGAWQVIAPNAAGTEFYRLRQVR